MTTTTLALPSGVQINAPVLPGFEAILTTPALALVVIVAIYLPTLMRGSRIPYTMSTVMLAIMIKNAYSKVVAMITG